MCTQALTGKGVKVAVLDSGCQLHKDIAKNIKRRISLLNYEFSNNPDNINDENGHGTFVAGIICDLAKDVDIVSIKVANKFGKTSYNLIEQGIYCAVLEDCNIINISLGGDKYNVDLHNAVKYATERNIPIVCAAGNDGHMFNISLIDYPAKFPETIAVGGIKENKDISDFSTIGKEIDFVAPSENIFSTHIDDSYIKMSGTSFAAPYISAIIALYQEKNSPEGKSIEEIKRALRAASIDLGEKGKDAFFGNGEININRLFKKNTGTLRKMLLRLKNMWNFVAKIF